MDQNQFASLVLEAEPTIYRVAKSILHREADVEDAAQEAILKAYQKRNSLKDIHAFRPWLTKIVINECYGLIRKGKDTLPMEEGLEFPAEEKESYTDLYEALRHLPPKIRIVIVLYYIEGYSVTEIHSILKIPTGTVKSRLSKGRKLLKIDLENKGDEEYEKKSMAKRFS